MSTVWTTAPKQAFSSPKRKAGESHLNYDKLTNADRNTVSRAMMSVLNALAPYKPEEKLLAAAAASETMLRAAGGQLDITLADLRVIVENMNKRKGSKTLIAQKTIERMMYE